jgi:hypothetical protein
MRTEPPAGTVTGAWVQRPLVKAESRTATRGPEPSTTVTVWRRVESYTSALAGSAGARTLIPVADVPAGGHRTVSGPVPASNCWTPLRLDNVGDDEAAPGVGGFMSATESRRLLRVAEDDHEQREGQGERHDGFHHKRHPFHRGDPDPVSASTDLELCSYV